MLKFTVTSQLINYLDYKWMSCYFLTFYLLGKLPTLNLFLLALPLVAAASVYLTPQKYAERISVEFSKLILASACTSAFSFSYLEVGFQFFYTLNWLPFYYDINSLYSCYSISSYIDFDTTGYTILSITQYYLHYILLILRVAILGFLKTLISLRVKSICFCLNWLDKHKFKLASKQSDNFILKIAKNFINYAGNILLCLFLSAPISLVYSLLLSTMRTFIYGFIIMKFDWYNNWKDYYCSQYPTVKEHMLYFCDLILGQDCLITHLPISAKELMFFLVIKILSSFSAYIFILTLLHDTLYFFWKGIMQKHTPFEYLIICFSDFIDLFKDHFNLKDLILFIVFTFVIVLTCCLMLVYIFINNLLQLPEDYFTCKSQKCGCKKV